MMFLKLFFFSPSQMYFQSLIYSCQRIQIISYPYLLTSRNPCISNPYLLKSTNLMYFKPLSTHVNESKLFQTLIYSRQQIQIISDPYLLVSTNPNYFRPISTHVYYLKTLENLKKIQKHTTKKL